MKLEKLMKLRTEVSNLESVVGKSLRICSLAPAQSSSHWQYFVLSRCFCYKGYYRIRHTKVHIVLHSIEAHWDATLDSLVALMGWQLHAL